MGQNARTRITFYALALAVSLLVLLCFTALPVVHAQTKPGPPGAPPVTVSVWESITTPADVRAGSAALVKPAAGQ
jgi:hypothetical protein